MYDTKVVVALPPKEHRILQRAGNATYVYYFTKRQWDPQRGRTVDDRVAVGKLCEDGRTMWPNDRWMEILGDPPETARYRNCGVYLALRQAMQRTGALGALENALPDLSRMIVALVTYVVDDPQASAQDLSTWAFHNFCGYAEPLSESSLSDLFTDLSEDGYGRETFFEEFLDTHGAHMPNEDGLVLAIDGTDQPVHGEYGFPRTRRMGTTSFGTALVVDARTGIPVHSEMYCGSLSDVFETPEAMARIRDLGFSRLSCAVGGGYATKDRMAALAEADLELCVMVPQDHEVRSVAMAEHAREVTQERHYSYTEDCYGMAIRDVACLGGTYDVHLFFDRTLAQVEVDAIHESAYALLDLARARASHTDASVAAFAPHILITRDPQDAATNKSFTAKVDTSRTQAEVNDAGYFCIVASRGTDAETVLHVQRLRERMERKHTRYTDSMRLLASPTRRAQVHAGTSFMAFVALVAYASFRHLAGDLVSGHETCSSLLGELRKVQVWKGTDGKGRLAYALTNRRREIFGHLGMDEEAVRDAVSQLEL